MAYAGGDTVHTGEVPWLPLAEKVFIRVLKTNRETGGFSVMIRAEPGGVLPRHRHVGEAEVYILKGQGNHPQSGDFGPGDFITEPKGALHDPVEFGEETELLMICDGPSEFLGEDGGVQHVMDLGMLDYLVARYGGEKH